MTDETNITADRDFVEYVVKQIVEFPDQVEIERRVDEMGVLILLKVAKEDMGKIIGKDGQTAKALRILLRIIGSKHNCRVNLKVVEPGEVGSGFEAATPTTAPKAEPAVEEEAA